MSVNLLFRRFLLPLCLSSFCIANATAITTCDKPSSLPAIPPLYGWGYCGSMSCWWDYVGLRLPQAEACNYYWSSLTLGRSGVLAKDRDSPDSVLCVDSTNVTPDGYCLACGVAYGLPMVQPAYCPPGYDLDDLPWQPVMCKPQLPAPATYTIRLMNDSGRPASSYLAEVGPDGNVPLKARVTCGDGEPVSGIWVKVDVDVVNQTGGHQHVAGRRPQYAGYRRFPATSYTDAEGYVYFTFYAPSPAGDHILTASCGDRDCGSESKKVWVGVKGLVSLYDTHLYTLIGSNDVHPDNHYLTLDATGSVVWLAELYHKAFPSDPILHYNDASLERGGLFDISANWSTGPRGHKSHRHGDIIDVRANPEKYPDTAIPTGNFEKFRQLACETGGVAQIHSRDDADNQHFHVEFHGCVLPENIASIKALPYSPPVSEAPSSGSGPAPAAGSCAGPNPSPTRCF